MSHHGFLSPSGQCLSFDHRANGYARAEGVGTLILKPLRGAIRDGDTIRAVIRGTGINQDGKTPGITVPSSLAQETLIRDIYRGVGLGFEETMFVEAHATGTAAGDPCESEALARVFGPTHDEIPLHVGAIKSNIGHLEGGSGVAGLIKAVYALEKGIIPPNANFEVINPKVPAEKWNMVFPTEAVPWPKEGLRRASVNSFGFGGTNGHCVLDDAYHCLKEYGLSGKHKTNQVVADNRVAENSGLEAPAGDRINEFIIPVSAFDKKGVQRNAAALAEYISLKEKKGPTDLLRDLTFTVCKKRTMFQWTAFTVATSLPQLAENLLKLGENSASKMSATPHIGFVFTGQGAQYQAMGRELLIFPAFRESLQQASDFMSKLWSPWSLMGKQN